eukprot:6467889-Amphidinium_carterae.2
MWKGTDLSSARPRTGLTLDRGGKLEAGSASVRASTSHSCHFWRAATAWAHMWNLAHGEGAIE